MSDKNYFEMFRCFSGITIEVPGTPGGDGSDDSTDGEGDDAASTGDDSFISACTEPTGLGWDDVEELAPEVVEEALPPTEPEPKPKPIKTKMEKRLETARLRRLRAKMDSHESFVRAKVASIHHMNSSPPLETIAEPDLVTTTPVSSENSDTTDDKYSQMEKSLRERDTKIQQLEKELTDTRAQLEELSVSLSENKAIGQTIEVFHDAHDANDVDANDDLNEAGIMDADDFHDGDHATVTDATVTSRQLRGTAWGDLVGQWSSMQK